MIALRIEPRYAETDQMGIIYHGHYITWFDMGRLHYLKEIGLPYHQLEKRGLLFPVHRVQVDYRQPARLGQTLRLETRLIHYSGVRIIFSYRLFDTEKPTLLAQGKVELAAADANLNVTRVGKSFPDVDRILKDHLEEDFDG